MSDLAATIQEPTVNPGVPADSRADADIASLLQWINGREVLSLAKGQNLFSQGSPSDSIYFLEKGKVKVSVVSIEGREAVVALLNAPCFLGEECLAGQVLRATS